MNAAVLHTFDDPPHFEQFPEPVAEDNEVIVHVRAAALKPIDKQMANGSHYAAYRKLPVVCGVDGVGCMDDGTRVSLVVPGRLTAAWHSSPSYRGRAVFRFLTILTTTSRQPL